MEKDAPPSGNSARSDDGGDSETERPLARNPKTVHERLRAMRAHLNLTQRYVVETLQWRWRKKLSRYETGESELTLSDATALAELYGMSLDWLAGRAPHHSGFAPGQAIADRGTYEALMRHQELDPDREFYLPVRVPKDPMPISSKEADALEGVIRALLAGRRNEPPPHLDEAVAGGQTASTTSPRQT